MTYNNFNEHLPRQPRQLYGLPFRHPTRLYERARNASNSVQETGLSIDGKIIGLQRQLRQTHPLLDVSPEIEKHQARMKRTLKENRFSGSANWVDYYRLHAQHDLLFQLTYAPVIFERHTTAGNITLQEQIVSEVYAHNMQLLKSEIRELDHPDAKEEEKWCLRGIIQEHTASALFNHARSPHHLTLPAATIGDLAHRTDLVHHTVVTGEYQAVNIQVKSDGAPEYGNTTPYFGGITIKSGDFGNRHADNLKTTRTLIRQFDDIADESDYTYLAVMQRQLFDKIDDYQHSSQEGIAA